jgi:hypothetical protein
MASAVALLAAPLFHLWRRRRAGAVLLDQGGSWVRWVVWLLGGWVSAVGIVEIFAARDVWLFGLAVVLGGGASFGAWSAYRFQLCEAGFWYPGRLIPYDKIEAYEISETGSLSVKTPGKPLKSCCNIPPALRSKTNELLASKCPSLQPRA